MKNSITRQIVVAILLGIGFGVVWGFGLGGIGSFIASSFGPKHDRDYEDIVVDQSGKPFIQTRVDNDWESMQYRTLDGQKVNLGSQDVSMLITLTGPYRAPRLFNYPMTWRERFVGITGGEDPPVSWILMRNDKRPGKAWFVGHQPRSRQLVGYIGRKGLRNSLPPKDEQFDVGSEPFSWGRSLFASTGYWNVGALGYGRPSRISTDQKSFETWVLFLLDGNQVQEVDLLTRQVRSIGNFDNVVSLGIVGYFPLNEEKPEEHPPESRLIVRTRDKIIIVNTFESTQSEFIIPDDLQIEELGIKMIGDDKLLLLINRGEWEGGAVVELRWINRGGKTQEAQTIQLVRSSNSTKPSDSVIPALLTPTLLPWVLGIGLLAPMGMLQDNQATSYTAAMTEIWHYTWMGFLIIPVLSMILTAIVYRWQKKYSRPHTLAWTLFVFLTTLPGFFAYWAMHRREPLAACPHCKHEVPRNREACASCSETFPEPKLLGTEVFA
jgi:hypothetical protein